MSNVLTIARRELAAYFTSPIGYIFMIVFVAISVGLYITTFFTFPVADMRAFFGNLPILLCVFIPAVTMRVWAEERKENTWEMLLTFPMKAWELTLGKFLASFAFFALTLAATFTVPVMLVVLGDPDIGAIAAGYFGTLLLGGFFLSIGIFFSGFYKDQIVAFVVTLLACFAIFLIGTGFIAAYIDDAIPGWGGMLSELIGLSDHYNAFTRGVIEIADILYFVAWTAVFLALNIIYIDGRNRAGARIYFTATVAILLVIGLLGNWLITDTSLGRFDVTEDKIYTVSDASERILSNVDTPVQVTLYISPEEDMTTGLQNLEQDVTDKLEELEVAAGGKLDFKTVHLNFAELSNQINPEQQDEGEEEMDVEKRLEERMLDKGIEPFSVQDMSGDQVTSKFIYSSIGVAYKDKPEEIIPQILPQFLPELEYRLVSTIYKLTREEKPVVALVAPQEAVNIPPEMRQIYQQMGQQIPETDDPYEILQRYLDYEKYDVRRVELSADQPLPDDYDTLVIINPRNFNERHRWEINRALHAGKSVVMAVQKYEWDYSPTRNAVNINKREENPGVNELLKEYGAWIDEDILMDVNHMPLTVNSGNALQNLLGGGTTLNLPMHIQLTNETMDADTSITSRLSSVFYLWGTALKMDEEKLAENGLEHEVLMRTTPNAWTVSAGEKLTAASFEEPSGGRQQYPTMAMVQGQFPDVFAGEERPDWPVTPPQPGQPPPPPPPEEEPPAEITPAPAKLILIGCSEMFRRNFVQQPGNLDLFLNSVDAVTLGDDIVNVRGRKPIDRTIAMPPPETRTMWKLINYGLAPGLIAGIGILTMALRRRSRNAYTLSYTGTAA